MKDIFEAEVFVDTVFSIESGAGNGNLFYMSDYSTMSEFLTDCGSWFSDEPNPEYVYKEWWGIPDSLINRTWLCPNFFEIRDALQMIDSSSIGSFVVWCRNNGHDLATDDPALLVTRYQDYVVPVYEPDPETAEPDDNPGTVSLRSLLGPGFGPVEIFDDNYN